MDSKHLLPLLIASGHAFRDALPLEGTRTPDLMIIDVSTALDRPPYPPEELLLPLPPKLAAQSPVSHKTFEQMNRKERRAFLSNKKR